MRRWSKERIPVSLFWQQGVILVEYFQRFYGIATKFFQCNGHFQHLLKELIVVKVYVRS